MEWMKYIFEVRKVNIENPKRDAEISTGCKNKLYKEATASYFKQ